MGLFAALALSAAGCAEPLEFADWVIPVPEGIPVHEYAYNPLDERTERVRLVEDLVLGNDANDPNQAFYRARALDVDADGNIWLLDGGNHRMLTFSPDGDFIRSIGREGQGPGEFEQPSELAIVDDTVVVRSSLTRVSLFDLRGEHIRDAQISGISGTIFNAAPLGDGTFVASHSLFDPEGTARRPDGTYPATFLISKFSPDARKLITYRELPSVGFVIRSSDEKRPAAVPRAGPTFGVARAGTVYITTGDEYQVMALDEAAEPIWALRAAYEPGEISEELVERAIETARARRPETTRANLIFPDRLPALVRVSVDGHGHVYVYPFIDFGDEPEAVRERPVDVYSAAGELLFSGMIEDRFWQRAMGDFVYAVGADRVSGETLVWRWRLEEPF